MISILSFDTALNHIGVCGIKYDRSKNRIIDLQAFQINTFIGNTQWSKGNKYYEVEFLIKKLNSVYNVVINNIRSYKPDYISVEIPITRHSVSRLLVSMACGSMLTCMGNFNIKCKMFKPQEWKKIVIGKGAADKTSVYDGVLRICSEHNIDIPKPNITKSGNITNSDVYDAIAINLALYYQIRQGVDHE
jgi:Holliday junction resolvasome RuvABC endonuclease subunit